jgi:hypothetical protein
VQWRELARFVIDGVFCILSLWQKKVRGSQVSYRQVVNSLLRPLAATALVVLMMITSLAIPSASIAIASPVIRTCAYGQLDVVTASPSGAYVAAGNNGIPFYIVNISHSACSLYGYPRISFSPQSFRGKTLRVVHGGGMIFVAVKPHVVVLEPGYTASFAIDFTDAVNQQDPSGPACMTKTATVFLPVLKSNYQYSYRPNVSFNFCFTGFGVALTPIQAGPIPKLG